MKKVIASFLILVGAVVSLDEHASATRKRGREDTPTLRYIEQVGRERGASPKLIRIVKTIACKESACGRNPVAAREKSKTWERKAKKIAKSGKEFESLMRSYGSTQLSGLYTKLEYGVEPHQLFDDEVNIPIAFEKAGKLLNSCKGGAYCAYARWNGSGEAARAYARAAIKLEEKV